RIMLTDIKPPVYHQLMKEKGPQINEWVLDGLKAKTLDLKGGFYRKMRKYFTDSNYAKKEKEILRAAHYYATHWEFEVIYPQNRNTYDIEQVKEGVEKGLSECNTFDGFSRFATNINLQKFLSLMGKLRYQQRWSRAVRMPQTSVMGHMLVVAILSYFASLECGACKARLINNFLGGLFHDIPEVLTRDIVSPIKSSVEGLDDIIKGIEGEQMRKEVYPLVPENIWNELEFFIQDEFTSKILIDGKLLKVNSDEINEKYNEDKYNPIDGELIRGCDHLSAYMEAYMSIKYGINSEQIQKGYHNLFQKYENRTIASVDFGQLFDYFRL
ncbi:MAG: HD domain-containing protein, partial [Clostridia bacterium]|nr:HD domain-containing protein [Clostridia bacterium]